jgi:PhnB protein
MSKPVKIVPDGCHTVTPYLVVDGAARAIEFYKQAFGAEEVSRSPGPDGKSIMHAALQIGDSRIYLCDEFPGAGCRSPKAVGATTVSLHLYLADVDAAFQRAVTAGAQPCMPPADMFWGDRYAKVSDPFGHEWGLATHKEDVSPEEMGRRSQAFFAQMAKHCS